MSKILITGVAGLLGAHLSRYLLNKGHNIIGIDNLFGGYREFVDNRIKFYELDLANANDLSVIFQTEKPDYVYHFAAYAAVGLSPFIRNFNYTNNILCSANIINECIKHDVKKLIFTSSMDVYGKGNPPFTEDQIPSPESPYGIAKYAVEMDIKLAHAQFGLDYTIIRPHNVIGIYQNIWDRYRNVIGIWIRQVLNGQPITIYGDGLQKRAFSDIEYYMDPFTRVMEECGNQTFNIGADKEYALIDVANMLKGVVNERGYNCKITHLEPRFEVKVAYSDHTKAKNLLGFSDDTDLRKTIYDMLVWAENQPNREIKKMEYEIDKGMYSYWKQ